jgi:GT2 family glycosyltransferase
LRRQASKVEQPASSATPLQVWAVVDCRDGRDGLTETLASVERVGWSHVLVTGEQQGTGAAMATLITEGGTAWICPMKAGDLLAPAAAIAYASAADRGSSILYADDDLLDAGGESRDPYLKPDWNPELFRHHDFLSGASLLAIDATLAADLPDKDWARSIVDSLLSRGDIPVHIPRILHHRRSRALPQVPVGSLTFAAAPVPTVSVLIPTRDQALLLETCLVGVDRTRFPPFELIIIDNGSTEPDACDLIRRYEVQGAQVLRRPGPFNFSVLNNEGARAATSDLLCLLNNDVEVIEPDWLKTLAVQAVRPEVGAVGARLLYPDGAIQHAGVVLGIGGGAGHAHRFQGADDDGYFRRAHLPQFVSAVTAACLVVERTKFLAVGGFDEDRFPVAFNDVDLCLRLNERGWQSMYEPRATLIHHESRSRGKDLTPEKRVRFAGELAALQERWATDRRCDPYHHPRLSRFSEKFVLDLQ